MAEHSSRLQPSINLHAPVTSSAALVPNVLPRKDEGSGKGHVQWSKFHIILAPNQDSNPGGRIQNHKRWPLIPPLHTKICQQRIPWRGVILFRFLHVSEMQLVLKKLELFSDVLNIGDFTIHPIIDDVVDSESITIVCHTLAVMTTSNSKITVCLQQHVISGSSVSEYPFRQQYIEIHWNFPEPIVELENSALYSGLVQTLAAYTIRRYSCYSPWEQLSCSYTTLPYPQW